MRPSASALSASRSNYSVSTSVTMGYGDYQLFIKTDTSPSSAKSASGSVVVPKEGIPQPVDPLLAVDMSNAPEDPRVTEALGKVYDWNGKVAQSALDVSGMGDIDDEATSSSSFAAFRRTSSADRAKLLAAMEAGRRHRLEKIQAGFSENYLLTMEGKLEANYARIQKIGNMPGFTATGQPQTDIPGKPFMRGIGALDFMKTGGRQPNYTYWELPEADDASDNVAALPQS